MSPSLASGIDIGRYRIVEAIGKGGMGEVYRAWDVTLDRAVALKILPPEMVRSEERLRRFVQEAKSASSLNHPHIITIHDVGEARLSLRDGDAHVRFIAMELVDGDTLRQKIHGGTADLRTVIGWLAQAADGLAKAHAAGIVHRDLKPDNIMVTRDGYAKVLDFGLAKLVERSDPSLAQDDVTMAPDATREGFIVGTIGYMSPEQIEAKPVDARSDVFAFGCILYEAATRRRPFSGASDIDVMHRIVHERPEPIDDTKVPADLRRVIRRCLAKSPDERLQSMREVALELRDIVANWDQLPLLSEPSHAPTMIVRAPSRRRWPQIAVGALLVVIVAIAAVFAVRALRKPRFTLEKLKIEKLTGSGNVIDFALTPDGKYLVQETDDSGQFSVWLKQTATGSNVRIVPASPVRISGVSVSPDGNYVYFVRSDDRTSRYQSLYRVTSLGGDPIRINSDADGAPGFSADGKQIAFLRMLQTKREFRIVTANSDGSGERVIAAMTTPSIRPLRPSWSPDGKSVAFASYGERGNEIVRFDTTTGARTTLGAPWKTISGVAWLPDGSGVIVTGTPKNGQSQIAFVAYPSGEVTQLRSDTTTYTGVSLTADGKAIAAAQQILFSTLSVGDINGEKLKAVTPADLVVRRVATGCDIPVFVAEDGSGFAVWVIDASGSPRKLNGTGSTYNVWASRDGSSIIFLSTMRDGKPHIFFIRSDGNGLRQLTNGGGERGATISPDGRWVMYLGSDGKIWKMQTEGGTPTVFADHALNGASYSPDGRFVAITQWHEDAEHHVVAREVVFPAEGGAAIADNPIFAANRLYHWGPQPDTYVYFDDVADANVFIAPEFGKHGEKQLTHFSGGRIFDVGFSSDGKRMYIARGERRNDVVMLSDFR